MYFHDETDNDKYEVPVKVDIDDKVEEIQETNGANWGDKMVKIQIKINLFKSKGSISDFRQAA